MEIQEIIEQGLVVCGQDPENPSHYYYFANSLGMRLNAVSAVLNDLPEQEQNLHLIPKIKQWFDKEPLSWFLHDCREELHAMLQGCLVINLGAEIPLLTDPVKDMNFLGAQLQAIFEFAGENCQAYLADGCAVAVSKYGDMAMCLSLDTGEK